MIRKQLQQVLPLLALASAPVHGITFPEDCVKPNIFMIVKPTLQEMK